MIIAIVTKRLEQSISTENQHGGALEPKVQFRILPGLLPTTILAAVI